MGDDLDLGSGAFADLISSPFSCHLNSRGWLQPASRTSGERLVAGSALNQRWSILVPLTVWALSHLSIRYGGASFRQNPGDDESVATISTMSQTAMGRCDTPAFAVACH
jgi:hypothetical protein